jgi:hypothetical protein
MQTWDNIQPYEYETSKVPSTTEKDLWHTLTRHNKDNSTLTCTCKGFQYSGKCKHIKYHIKNWDTKFVWRNEHFTQSMWFEFVSNGWNEQWGKFPSCLNENSYDPFIGKYYLISSKVLKDHEIDTHQKWIDVIVSEKINKHSETCTLYSLKFKNINKTYDEIIVNIQYLIDGNELIPSHKQSIDDTFNTIDDFDEYHKKVTHKSIFDLTPSMRERLIGQYVNHQDNEEDNIQLNHVDKILDKHNKKDGEEAEEEYEEEAEEEYEEEAEEEYEEEAEEEYEEEYNFTKSTFIKLLIQTKCSDGKTLFEKVIENDRSFASNFLKYI